MSESEKKKKKNRKMLQASKILINNNAKVTTSIEMKTLKPETFPIFNRFNIHPTYQIPQN